MGRYLLISVRLLDHRYHGRTKEGRGAEWPPSAMRLFQALVAGAKSRWTDATARAIEWLERLPPPVIVAPIGRAGRKVLTYVPNNNDPPGNERTGKWIRPMLLDGDRLIQYVWSLGNAEPSDIEHASVVAGISRHIRALGWGIDLAIGCGEIVDRVPDAGARRLLYRPCAGGAGILLRAPAQHSLASLERAHNGSLSRFTRAGEFVMESAEKVFITMAYATSPTRPYCAFRLIRNDDAAAYEPRQIKQLTGALRRLAAEALRGVVDDARISGTVLGHPPYGPRLSILPLPSLGHAHSDGLIRRIVFAEPIDGDGSLCRALSLAVQGRTVAFDGACGCAPAELDRIAEGDRVLHLYCANRDVWASATPVLLPGHNQRRQHRRDHVKNLERAHALVCKSLQQSRIEISADIEIDGTPYWQGARHAREYDPREKLAHLPRFHVKLKFDRPMCGPLSIGAGRHVGFGVLAACDSHEE